MTARADAPDPFDPVLNTALEHIARVGWSVTGVFPTETAGTVPFAYTSGLTALGLPELVIAGLPIHTMHAILNDVAGRDDGPWRHGQRLDDVITGGHAVEIWEGSPTDTLHLGTASRIYGRDRVQRAQQILWPDTEGRMPWQPGCQVADLQPLLHRN